MKNIAFLVYDISLTGGAERVALNLAEEFAKDYNTYLISLFKTNSYDAPKGYQTLFINEFMSSITSSFYTHSKKLKKCLLEHDIDILFVITAGVVTVAVQACHGTKVKTVYCEHSNLENRTYGKKHELRQLIGAKFSNLVVALTERDRQNFIKNLKIKPNKVMAIPNWIDDLTTSEQEYSLDSKLIITAGRLESVKGHDMLLKVAKIVKNAHPDWHWDIYGGGTLKEKLEKAASDSGLADFVSFKGNVSGIDKIYPEYSFFVLTSYYEGLPLVLLEAQKAKLPIVSFDCPTGPSEIVDNEQNGFIVPAYNIDDMASAINTLIETPDKRLEFSKNAPKKLNRFDKASVKALWEEIINTL